MTSPNEPLTCQWCGHTGEDVEMFEGPYSKDGPQPFCTDTKACIARGRVIGRGPTR